MAVFNVSFLKPGSGKGKSTYSIQNSQLSILENMLKGDGKLSPGDYDLLVKQAQSIANSPGLTPDERAAMNVKISAYTSDKSSNSLTDTQDIQRLNREVQDDDRKSTMLFANDPTKLLGARAAALHAKANVLANSIDQLNSSGQDASQHLNEYQSTINELQDTNDALAKINPGATAPTSGYQAYITTNAKGEINDVKIGRPGAYTGYVETNGLYGGMPVYGKVNSKTNGKNVFQLGGTTFEGSDLQISDPSTPGSFRSAPLLDPTTRGSGSSGVIVQKYVPIDPKALKTQSTIDVNGWAKGSSGALYQRQTDGSYKKYINTTPQEINLSDNDILNVPQEYENSIASHATQTIDGSGAAHIYPGGLPQGTTLAPMTGPVEGPQQKPAPAPAPQKNAAPVERAPQDFLGQAGAAIKSGVGYLQGLFGGGK